MNKTVKKGHICDAINQSDEPNIEVLYDLSELFKVFGDRSITFVKEITKIHEPALKTTLKEAITYFLSHRYKHLKILLLSLILDQHTTQT